MERGQLRVYMGAAPGVGATMAMLDEALRRQRRGALVVVGCIHTYDRPLTCERLAELSPDTPDEYLALDRVLTSAADIVLVDELARRNPSGSVHSARWQDVESLLDAGFDVITTMTIDQVDSLADVAAAIIGRPPDGMVPDQMLRSTDQIELVDISPAAIRRRVAHGNVLERHDIASATGELFAGDAFAQLRALMIRWMADRLTSDTSPPPVSGRVVVALTDSPSSDAVLRAGARLAHRSDSPIEAVHIVNSAASSDAAARAARRARVDELGGTYTEMADDDVAAALARFARAVGASHVVVGAPPRAHRNMTSSVARRVTGHLDDAEVAVITVPVPATTTATTGTRPGPTSRRRRLVRVVAGLAALAVLTTALTSWRAELSVATSLTLFLLAVVTITAVAGPTAGVVAALVAPILANWYLIEPYHTLRIADPENLLELAVFVSVAGIVSWFVTVASRRSADAERARHEATTLAALTASGHFDEPDVVVEQLRSTFGLEGVAVLSSAVDESVIAASGDAPASRADADLVAALPGGLMVVARGGPLSSDDLHILHVALGHVARALDQHRLRSVAAEADALARADELRTALLRAVSHDLRSPLAGIKAAVSSMRQPDVQWPDEVRDEFLESIEDDTDRLTNIITNLLDMSRLEAGALRPEMRTVSLEEVVPTALHQLGSASRVDVDLPDGLPLISADAALLERVIVNLTVNALRWTPMESMIQVRALRTGTTVQLHVIDRGPGIPLAQRAVVLQPFHRLDDSATGGLGLGLAIVDRLVAAMGGVVELRDTPGGGLTVVVSLVAADHRLSRPSTVAT